MWPVKVCFSFFVKLSLKDYLPTVTATEIDVHGKVSRVFTCFNWEGVLVEIER